MPTAVMTEQDLTQEIKQRVVLALNDPEGINYFYGPHKGMQRWRLKSARVEFKIADSWVGLFWRSVRKVRPKYQVLRTVWRSYAPSRSTHAGWYWQVVRRVDIWVCIIPWFPLHLVLTKTLPGRVV